VQRQPAIIVLTVHLQQQQQQRTPGDYFSRRMRAVCPLKASVERC
jgi:hypothetical protein